MEIWKDIKGFEGVYQISNFGNVKSIQRKVFIKNSIYRTIKEKLITKVVAIDGYYLVGLHINKIQTTKKVHQLVAESFLNHNPCGFDLVVNHKDFNRLNNHIDNLEIVTSRENTNQKHLPSTSIYVGVHWEKNNKKWMASIRINGPKKYLGYFINEIDAHNAYQKALKSIENNEDSIFQKNQKNSSIIY